MVRRSVRSVILDRYPVNSPRAGRVRGLAHGEVEVIRSLKSTVWERIKGEHDMEPTLSRLVEVATGIGDERSSHESSAVDRRRIPIERVEVCHSSQCVISGIVNCQNIVDGFHDEAIAHAQSL